MKPVPPSYRSQREPNQASAESGAEIPQQKSIAAASSIHVRPKGYVLVWVALLVLLGLTWGAAQINLGPFNTTVALGIAFLKMMLVVLFFMHVRYESRLTWVFVAAGVIWFAIMVDLTLSDYLTRGNVPGTRQTWQYPENTKEKHPVP